MKNLAFQQLSMSFVSDLPVSNKAESFSHGQVSSETSRQELEHRYASIIEETDRFSRKTVSFQANKVSKLHSWFKYREGFSAELVELLLLEFGLQPGDSVLDPFAGSCTTLLEAKFMGLDAVGIELLPHCHLAWEAKSRVYDYDLDEIKRLRYLIDTIEPPEANASFPHLTITETAFSEQIERSIMDYAHWFAGLPLSGDTRLLADSLLMSLLEDVSFTRKDGQYLRWDIRAQKIVDRNRKRTEEGKKAFVGIDKGRLPTVQDALLERLSIVIRDLVELNRGPHPQSSSQQLIKGNTLWELPTLPDNLFSAVITSPPYANRYDYTRTYALELAYLDVQHQIFSLRQNLLSCTVENKPKFSELESYYKSIGAEKRYEKIAQVVRSSSVLGEVDRALIIRNERGEINNKGVLGMINQYFAELTFVFAEVYRVSKKGAVVAFVNDNVRYAGETIPVDLISTSLAESLGFIPIKVYVIPQRKGNSSQQMKKFGRREMRKSITIWQKP